MVVVDSVGTAYVADSKGGRLVLVRRQSAEVRRE